MIHTTGTKQRRVRIRATLSEHTVQTIPYCLYLVRLVLSTDELFERSIQSRFRKLDQNINFKKNIIGHSVPVFGNLELLATQHLNDLKDSTATDRQRIRLLKIFNCPTTSRTLQAKLSPTIIFQSLECNHWNAIITLQ